MKKSLPVLIVLFHSLIASAQTKEIENLWKSQADSGKVSLDLQKIEYLEVTEDLVANLLDKQPSFGMYKDNYIITGIPTNQEVNRNTADAKIQISISQRLTKTILPYNSFLMLTYTQKNFWNIYKKSAPFGDTNYNPGVLLNKPIVYNNRFKGMVSLAFEHESNGKDSIDSRDWNNFVLSGTHYFNVFFSAQAKIWAGWTGDNNKDIYKYRGYGLLAFNFRSFDDYFWASAVINPRDKFRNVNLQMEVNFKMGSKSNQYFFIQWYNGYGESLYDYNKYTSMLRAGVCIKPPMRNLF